MNLEAGQSIWYESQKKTIKKLLKNINGDTIIEWESKNSTGAVTPSIWKEWKDGVNQNIRRADRMCVCEPKRKNTYVPHKG